MSTKLTTGTITTKSGRILTDDDLDRLAERAEEGFDLSTWTPRPGRPSLSASPGCALTADCGPGAGGASPTCVRACGGRGSERERRGPPAARGVRSRPLIAVGRAPDRGHDLHDRCPG